MNARWLSSIVLVASWLVACAQVPVEEPTDPKDLIGKRWNWVAYRTAPDSPLERDVDTSNYLYFDSDTSFSGFSGCNHFGGSCELTSTAITVKEGILSTLIGCPQVKDYVRGLYGEVPYRLQDSVLTLFPPKTNTDTNDPLYSELVFVRAS